MSKAPNSIPEFPRKQVDPPVEGLLLGVADFAKILVPARPIFGRPPGRNMMEVEAEEFWGKETNQFNPYKMYPDHY